ncbi:hypothetical protein E1263_26170 [Kribbella antibiotica]|uniref:Secreted protein n=1 Tax=Kribbella antibiotica TaxID=190195 RepID=A0A4R4ZBQ1_9ACTN|nr:hypothetical protein [Kribbella antibiotica]TDD55436.1 hypothetical protein E1263_26170 [Kribbella antibiotica]
MPHRRGVLLATALILVLGGCSGESGPVSPSPSVDDTIAIPPPGSSPSETPGPGVTTPGIRMTAVPRSDGSFDMVEDVILPEAADSLQVQVPTSGELLPGLMTKTAPRASDLQLLADDSVVPLDTSTVDTTRDLTLPTPATKLRLTYRLTGTTVRRTPQRPQRAAAALRPLLAPDEDTLPTSVSVSSGLLNAVCPLLTETRCAVGDPPNLTIRPDIPASQALVVIQLDLP